MFIAKLGFLGLHRLTNQSDKFICSPAFLHLVNYYLYDRIFMNILYILLYII